MKNFELLSFSTDRELAQAAVDAWLADVQAAAQKNAVHTTALSGGRITKTLCSLAVTAVQTRQFSLKHVHFFWADERCLPPTDAESNYRMAQELLFTPLGIERTSVHRIQGEAPSDFACAEAEGEICRVASLNGDGLPVLDLIFLGLGEDGHVASLFPGHPRPDKRFAYAAVHNSPKPPPDRITLTYEAIAIAKQVWVLISGKGKENALRESLQPNGQTPLAAVLKSRAQTRIFTNVRL